MNTAVNLYPTAVNFCLTVVKLVTSKDFVHLLWQKFGQKTHLVRTRKLNWGSNFVDKPCYGLDWLDWHKRILLQITSNQSLWLILMQAFFAEAKQPASKRTPYTSMVQLETSFKDYLNSQNKATQPFLWRARKALLAHFQRTRNYQ